MVSKFEIFFGAVKSYLCQFLDFFCQKMYYTKKIRNNKITSDKKKSNDFRCTYLTFEKKQGGTNGVFRNIFPNVYRMSIVEQFNGIQIFP